MYFSPRRFFLNQANIADPEKMPHTVFSKKNREIFIFANNVLKRSICEVKFYDYGMIYLHQ